MRYSIALSVFFVFANAISASSPRNGVLKRDTQLSCPSGGSGGFGLGSGFDILCAADDGTTICHNRLSVCCQLPNGKTPYSCSTFDEGHCCGTDKPACGADPSCKNIKGERDVVSAESAVYPTTAAAAPTTTGRSATNTAQRLATMTGEKNPNATGGAGVLSGGIKEEGALVVLAAAMALL